MAGKIPRKGWKLPLASPRLVAKSLLKPVAFMEIRLNGQPHTLESGPSVAALVASLALDARQVAVERNGEIVPRSQWADTALASGDAVEIVRFIGGG